MPCRIKRDPTDPAELNRRFFTIILNETRQGIGNTLGRGAVTSGTPYLFIKPQSKRFKLREVDLTPARNEPTAQTFSAITANTQTPMLELRPTCEHCNTTLPPDSVKARICSYECTFCASCVETILFNVCPNCGGGFVPRPVRPTTNWRDNNCLRKDPAGIKVMYRPVDSAAHAMFAAAIKSIPPEAR
jgi:uncharacterized protein